MQFRVFVIQKSDIFILISMEKITMDQQKPKSRRFYLFRELLSFVKVGKRWWMVPVIIMLIIAAGIIIFGQSSAVSPFIYALF